ncbi:hypothetical protein CYMTET_45060 [Cymbomonas tetramitiformis]|uniref:HIT domain-containing protein n=1 Tax=Cymbomonas tetramitiformis TaxID=36881 RepID=A0AAE0BYZ7_9CHLO|nr:hypothetical protein CYMTET_45060 [Cymbomonas tetramitiformis]
MGQITSRYIEKDFIPVPQLSHGKHKLCNLPLCEVWMTDDTTFCWLVLIPRKKGLREFHDLPQRQQMEVMKEITLATKALEKSATEITGKVPTKMNVGALGNICSELHVHIIARYEGDAAWPGPVWGQVALVPYANSEKLKEVMATMTKALLA